MRTRYDVIVVGGGHAGCEAAYAAARLGAETLLVSADLSKLATMSCNPAVGGIAKGQIVREVDALGGGMGAVTDAATLQFRMLNMSKGPAVWSPRAQCDKALFSRQWRTLLDCVSNVHLWDDQVVALSTAEDYVQLGECKPTSQVTGVVTRLGIHFTAGAVVLTAGTFLNGLIHVGRTHYNGGRMGEAPSLGLSDQLAQLGLQRGRMKTGTPVRLDFSSIDTAGLERQEGNCPDHYFSYHHPGPGTPRELPQLPCYITYTNPAVHERLRQAFDDSPLYNGTIQSLGPRYCPSIETKLVNFADRDRHQLFIEPEGCDTTQVYLNGFSSSLPWEAQADAVHLIPGLEHAHIIRPGYAIEYDYFDPTQLHHTLESRVVERLYLAGQVNGTTGYEEAAGQGLVAGTNAALRCSGRRTFTLGRDEAYIGVLIDDLVLRGVDEPYRMFTSRAEHRLLLRQDNADERLTAKGYQVGLVDQARLGAYRRKAQLLAELRNHLAHCTIPIAAANHLLLTKGGEPVSEGQRAEKFLLRPEVRLNDLLPLLPDMEGVFGKLPDYRVDLLEALEVVVKYAGYIDKERQAAEHVAQHAAIPLRGRIDYAHCQQLSFEARQKLQRIDPANIAEAQRIPGVSQADVAVLLTLLGR